MPSKSSSRYQLPFFILALDFSFTAAHYWFKKPWSIRLSKSRSSVIATLRISRWTVFRENSWQLDSVTWAGDKVNKNNSFLGQKGVTNSFLGQKCVTWITYNSCYNPSILATENFELLSFTQVINLNNHFPILGVNFSCFLIYIGNCKKVPKLNLCTWLFLINKFNKPFYKIY